MTACDQPLACTLSGKNLEDRLASIAQLARDALRSHRRDDLVLCLSYAPEASARVHAMLREEQACCAFLNFRLEERRDELQVTITAPEGARELAATLFDHFTRRD